MQHTYDGMHAQCAYKNITLMEVSTVRSHTRREIARTPLVRFYENTHGVYRASILPPSPSPEYLARWRDSRGTFRRLRYSARM